MNQVFWEEGGQNLVCVLLVQLRLLEEELISCLICIV